jgi:hypothetical protein
MSIDQWVHVQQISQCSWTCGHCSLMVGGNLGYYKMSTSQGMQKGVLLQPNQVTPSIPRIVICPHCEKPTYFEGTIQMPGVAYGAEVAHLPPDVVGLYKEARNCVSVAAFTASILATRKLLMNVAVAQGASPNGTFQGYVGYLADNGYIPTKATGWIDHIRKKGNEATHEIPPMSQEDAKDLLAFMEMILKTVYEFPARVPGASGGTGS